MESDLGTLGRAPVPDRLFFMKARILHDQMPAPFGVAGAQRAPEVAKRPMGMALRALGNDLARADLTSGKEIAGALPDIRNLRALTQPGTQGQSWGQAFPAWR